MNNDEPSIFERAQLLTERFDYAYQLRQSEKQQREELRCLLLDFIEVMDSFDRYLRGRDGEEGLRTVRLIARQLEKALEGAGVKVLVSEGQMMDAERHEITGIRPGETDDLVLEEIQRGYEWDGQVLRKARVVVSRQIEKQNQE